MTLPTPLEQVISRQRLLRDYHEVRFLERRKFIVNAPIERKKEQKCLRDYFRDADAIKNRVRAEWNAPNSVSHIFVIWEQIFGEPSSLSEIVNWVGSA
jgi:hypothetical protein